MIGIIAAVSSNGVIGKNNSIPWNYPEDMKHFRNKTSNSIVIMGSKTFKSIGNPLPKRRNIVLSKSIDVHKDLDLVETAYCMEDAMLLTAKDERDVWIIGGAFVYEKGMDYADKIVLTLVPDYITGEGLIRFPFINPQKFSLKMMLPLCPEDPNNKLQVATYERIK